MKNKSKKGGITLLPETTLKFIIAVLCIIALVYLAVSLYSLFIVKSELAQARSTLEKIVARVNSLNDEESSELINSPKDWVLISYEDNLCMCDKNYLKESSEKCCQSGISESVKTVKVEDVCVISQKIYSDCIYLENLPLYIYFSKLGENVNIIANKPTGILKELLERKEGEQTFLELIKSKIKPSGVFGTDREELETIFDAFFEEKRMWYSLKIESKLTNQDVFNAGNYRSTEGFRALEEAKELRYELAVLSGQGKGQYEIILKYKEK